MTLTQQSRQQQQSTQQTQSSSSGVQKVAQLPLKVQPTPWTRTFTGKAKGVSFELRLQRDASGQLHGRYITTPGNPAGWPLEGQLLEDNSFTLKGTENEALFEGVVGTNAAGLSGTFRNKEFQVGALRLGRSQLRLALPTIIQPGATPVAASEGQTSAASQQPEMQHWSQTLTPAMRSRLPALSEPGFLPALNAMCSRLNIQPDMLMAVMTFESADARHKTRGLDPQADNGKGYYGLIQFGDDAAADMNMRSGKDFVSMSATQQLVYVEQFLKQHGLRSAQAKASTEGRPLSLEELYMSVLGGNSSAAYRKAWTTASANPARYANNIGLDSNHDGNITPTEAADAVRLHWRDVYGNNLDERSQHLEREWSVVSGKRQWRVKEHEEVYSRPLNGLSSPQAAVPATPQTSQVPVATSPVLTGQSASPVSPVASAPATTGPAGLSSLDRLLGLPTPQPQYAEENLARARQLIAAQPEAQQAAYYLDLQTKTTYRNQRNNATVEGGASAADSMCNVTALAMCLDTAGVAKPNNLAEHRQRCQQGPKLTEAQLSGMQYEDYLDLVRRFYKMGPRTSYMTLSKIAAQMGAKWETIATPAARPWKRQMWQDKAGAALGAGQGVLFSIRGHIVRLQGIEKEGLVVDDPFGNIKLLASMAEGAYRWEATNPRPGSSQSGAVGNNQVWGWSEVEQHVLWWMGAVSRA